MNETRSLSRDDEAQPQLEIVQGLHAGVRLALNDGEYFVGPTPSADIVLRDNGVLTQHALLRIEHGEVRVEATGGALTVGTMRIAAGHGCRVKLPAVITIGEASLRLSRGSGADRTLAGRLRTVGRGFSNRPMEVAGGVLLCAFAVTVASQAISPSAPDAAKSEVAMSGPATVAAIGEDRASSKAADAAAAASTIKQAADDLGAKLRDAGINSVRITAENQRISAQGRVNETQAAQWASIQRWFDEAHGANVVLTANVGIGQATGGPLLRLQSVWYGERPYIVADNGSHYYEGSVLDSGWILQSINDERVLLRKDNETFALTYR